MKRFAGVATTITAIVLIKKLHKHHGSSYVIQPTNLSIGNPPITVIKPLDPIKCGN